MRFYETTLVINPRISDGDREKIVKRIQNAITVASGEVVDTVNQGVQRLSYPLKKQNEANYTVIRHNTAPLAIKEIRQQIKLIEDVYLSMIVLVSSEKGNAAIAAATPEVVAVEETPTKNTSTEENTTVEDTSANA